MRLVFATRNKNKVSEIQQMIPSRFRILSLHDVNCFEDIPETKPTIERNASQKSFFVYEKYHHNCFADDTGLEIEVLDGKPGVKSARYAGLAAIAENNISKVMYEMKGKNNRSARFKTVISLVIDGKEQIFDGTIEGTILFEKKGINGFGYDSIFVPKGSILSFAEMTPEEKNKISHRAIAVNKLVEYLNKHF